MQNRITALTTISNELDDLSRRREASLQWVAELRSTVSELKQRKARLRPEAAQHDLNQVTLIFNVFCYYSINFICIFSLLYNEADGHEAIYC